MIHVEPCLRTQDLAGDGCGVSPKQGPLQLVGEMMRTDDLRDARCVVVFLRADEVKVGALIITRFLLEKADDDSAQFGNFFGRCDLKQGQVAVLVQKRNLVRAERRVGRMRVFQSD